MFFALAENKRFACRAVMTSEAVSFAAVTVTTTTVVPFLSLRKTA